MACEYQSVSELVQVINPHELARDLHADQQYFILDCRPVLSYNSCHISGAINVNFTGMIKKRFLAGKISLPDLLTTEDGKTKFRSSTSGATVVYDDCTSDVKDLGASHAVLLVIKALVVFGKSPYLLRGGLNEFNVLHPSLCEISLPSVNKSIVSSPPPNPTTPEMRDQPLDWKKAPPVHVLNYLVLGGEKDAKSKEVFEEFKIKYVLNMTPLCPNYFESDSIRYKRIAVMDTGSQKMSNFFNEAFDFIEQMRSSGSCILIHCMAGISRSVTLVIAYLMQHFGLTMQQAYQFVKEKRPAISPNLNFMGQLVEFEREIQSHGPIQHLDISAFLPTSEQEKLSENVRARSSESSSTETTPEPIKCNELMPQPTVLFALKPLVPKTRHKKSAPVNGVGETRPVPAVSPKSDDKTNPIVSMLPSNVAYIHPGPECAEFPAVTLPSLPKSTAVPLPSFSKGTAVADASSSSLRSSHDPREPVSLEGMQRAFVRLAVGDRTPQD